MYMADEKKQALTLEELEKQKAEQLPDRDETSRGNANVPAPGDRAKGSEVPSDRSMATADAVQNAPIR
jgi:hypothetical protein